MIPNDLKYRYDYNDRHRKRSCEGCGERFSIDFFPSNIIALCRECSKPEKPKARPCLCCGKDIKTVKSMRICGPCKTKEIFKG